MKNVLQVVMNWGAGGIEKNICNYGKYLSKDKFNLTVFALEKTDSIFDVQLHENGIRMIIAEKSFKGNFLINTKKRITAIINAINEVKPDIVHINITGGVAFRYVHAIKKEVSDVYVVVHCHGDGIDPPYVFLKSIYYKGCRLLWEKEADYCIACTKQIGRFMYTNKVRNNSKYSVCHYAIDTKKYRYSREKREICRKKYDVKDNEILIGTIGRISDQKNPFFIVEIIKELSKSSIKYKFLWIGKGELEDKIHAVVAENELDNTIIFGGLTRNIPEVLSAMDVFILPSKYEGLGIVNIEAQISGLYTIVSDSIPKEAKLCNELFCAVPIREPRLWKRKIDEIISKNELRQRRYPEIEIKESGFDIVEIIRDIEDIYNRL